MRLLFLILLLPFFTKAQNITINGSGLPITINGVGGSTITINWQDYSPIDYEGAVNLLQQDLTTGQSYYYGWPMSYAIQDKRAVVFRRGSVHTRSESKMVRFITNDGGATWSNSIIHEEAGIDIRNYGGGNTSDGTVLIFFGRWLSDDTWTTRCLRSVNGGTTFTESSNLQLYIAGSSVSPHGPLIELETGKLIQSFYGGKDGIAYDWTLESTDSGITWGNPVLICQGTALYEPSIAYLGEGKLIAGIRNDVGASNKDMIIYNSDDYGATWDSIGKCLFNGFDLPGVSPLLFKKDANTAYVISTNRSSDNHFIQIELPFGDYNNTGLIRYFYDGRPAISGNNIEFGYPALLAFNSADILTWLIGFYDASSTWVSGDEITDVMIYPAFQKKYFISRRTSGTAVTGTYAYTPQIFIVDEMSCANTPNSQNLIREAGNYTIRVEAEFSGSGTSREIRVQRYNSSGVFVETMYTTGASSSNTYDFETTQAMGDERILINVIHDANPLTITLIRLHITKLND